MFGGVASRGLGVGDWGLRFRSWRPRCKGCAAFGAELGLWQILKSTARAAVLESTATFDTKLGPLGILRAAACAAHGASLLHDLVRYQLNFARSPSSAFTYPIGALEKSQACTFLGTILVIVRATLSLKIWLSWMSGRDNM